MSTTENLKIENHKGDLSCRLNKSQLIQLVEADWIPPDGGWGWMCVFACSLSFGLIVGISRTFGVIYNDVREAFPEALHIEVALIPSMIIILVVGLGVVAGALTAAYSARTIAFIGGLLSGIGVGLNFFAMNIYYMQITFLIAGIGAGLSCNPGLMTVPKYFRKRRTQALGFALSGTALGTIIQPHILQFLVACYGFRGALLIFGGLLFHISAGALLYRNPVTKKKVKKLKYKIQTDLDFQQQVQMQYLDKNRAHTNKCIRWFERHVYLDLTLFYQPKFIIFLISVFFLTIGYPQIITFVPPHAIYLQYSTFEAGLLLSVFSAGDLVGRFLNGFIFDKKIIGKQTGYIISTFMVSLTLIGISIFENYFALCICLAFYGYFAGCVFILIPALLSENHGAEKLQSSLGFARTTMGMSCLISPILSGYIVDVTGTFSASFLTAGIISVFSSVAMWALIPVPSILHRLYLNCAKKTVKRNICSVADI